MRVAAGRRPHAGRRPRHRHARRRARRRALLRRSLLDRGPAAGPRPARHRHRRPGRAGDRGRRRPPRRGLRRPARGGPDHPGRLRPDGRHHRAHAGWRARPARPALRADVRRPGRGAGRPRRRAVRRLLGGARAGAVLGAAGCGRRAVRRRHLAGLRDRRGAGGDPLRAELARRVGRRGRRRLAGMGTGRPRRDHRRPEPDGRPRRAGGRRVRCRAARPRNHGRPARRADRRRRHPPARRHPRRHVGP